MNEHSQHKKMTSRQFATAAAQVVIATVLSGCGAAALAEKAGGCPHTVQRYWQEFRTAVVKNDVDRIADLTQFPFVVSAGTLDADRTTKTVRRSEFIKIFPRLLTNDPGVNPQPSTMRDLINENERLTTLFCSPDGGQIRVGDWVFQQIGQNWRFMQAYAEDKIEIDNGKEGVR